jgi:hypothetical protein
MEIAKKYFVVLQSRMSVQGFDLVVGRYSVLPFYKELEDDIKSIGARLINTFHQHCFIADMQNYVEVLGNGSLTPKTWYRLEDVPEDAGPFVLKGATNSRKNNWSSLMYAATKSEAIEVYLKLQRDPLINEQGIYIRKYVPLVKLTEGINGMPISEEYRFFVYKNKILCGAFYWSNFTDDLKMEGKEIPKASNVPIEFLSAVTRKLCEHVNFYTIDVAKTQSGEYVVVEINEGAMSGLSDNDPDILYKNLKQELWTFKPAP